MTNHYKEFEKFLDDRDVLSDAFKSELMYRLSTAMEDAFNRGRQQGIIIGRGQEKEKRERLSSYKVSS